MKIVYYKFACDLSESTGDIEQQNNQHETLMRGVRVDEQSLDLPYRFSLNIDPDEGLHFLDYYDGDNLMSKRLVKALLSVGVDNLQTFPAKIVDQETGKSYNELLVVNVIGLVSCAVDEASQSSPLADVKYYFKLIIDPARAGNLKMFRLAESRIDVIVSEEVATRVRKGRFKGVVLEPVENP